MKFKAYEREKPEHTMAYVRISSTSITDAAEREQSVFTHFAEPQGGKSHKEGLTQKFAFYSLSESISGRR